MEYLPGIIFLAHGFQISNTGSSVSSDRILASIRIVEVDPFIPQISRFSGYDDLFVELLGGIRDQTVIRGVVPRCGNEAKDLWIPKVRCCGAILEGVQEGGDAS